MCGYYADMHFTRADYDRLHEIVFRPGYPGYKPDVTEIPNGDGRADTEKRYAHVSPKYWRATEESILTVGEMNFLKIMYEHALYRAKEMFRSAGGASPWMPLWSYSSLRILDYPPGATSAPHRDFDLFTTMLYRDHPECFRVLAETDHSSARQAMRKIDPQVHIGELLGMGCATLHEVVASAERQRSIVFFAIPEHSNVLSPRFDGTGTSVRDWLNGRMARSRTVFVPYVER